MLDVGWFGVLDLVVHGKKDFHVTLSDIAVVPKFGSDSMSMMRRILQKNGH